jgi:uncharacterized protein YlxW (UPF0749 family)
MRLLSEVMLRPLDPGYALAAARREQGRARRLPAVTTTLVVALLCGLLASTAVAQLRRPVPGAVAARRALEAEIERRSVHAEEVARANAALRQQIGDLRAQALAGAGATPLAQQVEALGRQVGELGVSGPGLEITLDDAPSVHDPQAAPAADAAQPGRVLDRDVQIVVNGLWAAGAEAVAVNGYRLTSLSAIRSAGEAVLVDFQPLVPPYRIAALGDPEHLRSRLAAGLAGAYLNLLTESGIRYTVSARSTMELTGAAATFELHYARPVDAADVPPTTQEAGS